VFEIQNGLLNSFCIDTFGDRPTRSWLEAESHGFKPNLVDVGWHIYLDIAPAERLLERLRSNNPNRSVVIRKVRYRGAHHDGIGDGGWNKKARIVVAKEMYIFKGEL
jgi:hypothetical protein